LNKLLQIILVTTLMNHVQTAHVGLPWRCQHSET